MFSPLFSESAEVRGAAALGRSSLPMACVDSRTYHASAVEQAWFSHNAAGRLCQLAKMQRGAIAPWLDYNQRAALGQGAESPRPNELDILSYWQLPGGRTEYIEPLTGMARHPLVVGGYCGASLRNGSRCQQQTDGPSAEPRVPRCLPVRLKLLDRRIRQCRAPLLLAY